MKVEHGAEATRRAAAEDANVVGLDVDESALDFARRQSPEQVDFVRGDAACLVSSSGFPGISPPGLLIVRGVDRPWVSTGSFAAGSE